MEILPRSPEEGSQRIRLLLTFTIEIIVLIFLSTLAYFTRDGSRFPLRRTLFSPSDPSIGFLRGQGDRSMQEFDYGAFVARDIVVILSFCLPLAIILTCELMSFKRFQGNRLTIVVTCFACRVSVSVRRILRFSGVFLTGMLITIIFNDVTKFMVGRPRPRFLEVCQLKQSACFKHKLTIPDLVYCDPDTACTNGDKEELAWARKSFPSFHASITSFAAFFMAFYIHKVLTRDSNLRLLGPLLSFSFVIMSLLCCLARYSLYLNHWIDLVVGFFWGALVAFYMTIFALDNFKESSEILRSERRSPQNLDSPDWSKNKLSGHWSPWRWNENDPNINSLPTVHQNVSTRDNNNNNNNNSTNITTSINDNNNNSTTTTTNNNNNNNKPLPFHKQASKTSNYSFGFTDIIANESKKLNNETNNNNNFNKNNNNSNNNYNNNSNNPNYNNTNKNISLNNLSTSGSRIDNNNTNNNGNNNNNDNFSLYRHKSRDQLNISDYY